MAYLTNKQADTIVRSLMASETKLRSINEAESVKLADKVCEALRTLADLAVDIETYEYFRKAYLSDPTSFAVGQKVKVTGSCTLFGRIGVVTKSQGNTVWVRIGIKTRGSRDAEEYEFSFLAAYLKRVLKPAHV